MDQSAKRVVQNKKASTTLAANGILLQRRCACGGAPGVDDLCEECRGERLLTQRFPTNSANPLSFPSHVREVLATPGQVLDAGISAYARSRFGHDFSKVRVHTDTRAAESARSLDSFAYTVGQHIAFGEQQYVPQTTEGKKLLIHELTHVVQQQSGNVSGPEAGTGYLEQAEWEAERNAHAVERGGSPVSSRNTLALMRMSLKHVSSTSGENDNMVKDAFDEANGWLPKAISQLDRYLKTEKSAGSEADQVSRALDQNFFHSDYQPELSLQEKHEKGGQILDLLKRMSNSALSVESDPENQEDCQRGPTGHSLPGVYVVHVCPTFFGRRSLEQRAGTIIHEMAHILGTSKKDLAYSNQRKYLVLTPDEALNNAESYALFVQQLATPGSTFPGAIPKDTFRECAGLEKVIEKAIAEAERRLQVLGTHGYPDLQATRSAKRAYEKLRGRAYTIQCEQQCQPQSSVYLSKRGSTIDICPPWKDLSSEEQVEQIISALFQEFAGLKSNPKLAFRYARDVYRYFDEAYLQGGGSTSQPPLQEQREKKEPTPSKESGPPPGEAASPEEAGHITLEIRGIPVVLQPDAVGPLKDERHDSETNIDFHVDDLKPHREVKGKVTEFTTPSITIVIQTIYKPGVKPGGPSEYGVGTRPEDVGAHRTLEYHEQSHVVDAVNYLRSHPIPRFEGKRGMAGGMFESEYARFRQRIKEYNEALIKDSIEKTHCVGKTIDVFDREHKIEGKIQCGNSEKGTPVK